jgi:hypothetical protein
MAKKKIKLSARKLKKTKACPPRFNLNFDFAAVEARIVGLDRVTLEQYLKDAKIPRVRQQLKALMLGMPDHELEFLRRRPPTGQAFLCANDAAYLMHVYIHGHPPVHVSLTNTRSRAILEERGLIQVTPTTYGVTTAGQDLVNQILSLGYGGVPKPFTSVTEEAGHVVSRGCWHGGTVGKGLNYQSIPRKKICPTPSKP